MFSRPWHSMKKGYYKRSSAKNREKYTYNASLKKKIPTAYFHKWAA
jgi:hypothetical protein